MTKKQAIEIITRAKAAGWVCQVENFMDLRHSGVRAIMVNLHRNYNKGALYVSGCVMLIFKRNEQGRWSVKSSTRRDYFPVNGKGSSKSGYLAACGTVDYVNEYYKRDEIKSIEEALPELREVVNLNGDYLAQCGSALTVTLNGTMHHERYWTLKNWVVSTSTGKVLWMIPRRAV